jgi:hypothetical protein
MLPGYAYSTIGYADLKNELTYTPRAIATGTSLPLITGANSGNIGMDGFSVPAYWLYKLLPSVGYVQQFSVSVSLPAVSGSVIPPLVVSRRLLQVVDSGVLANTNQASAFSIVQDGNSTAITASAVLATDVGSTKTSVTTAATAVGVVTAGVVGVGIGLAATMSSAASTISSSAAAAAAAIGARARMRI